MNTSRFYLFLVFYALAFAQDDQIIKYEDLFDRNGLMYAPDQDTSFTGNVKDIWAQISFTLPVKLVSWSGAYINPFLSKRSSYFII